LIPNPIRKVLSSMRAHRVRALLMGGQACVFYGAAEFGRDSDFAILADAANLERLRKALAELQAEPIAVPPFGETTRSAGPRASRKIGRLGASVAGRGSRRAPPRVHVP
jgi:hypothetical protein